MYELDSKSSFKRLKPNVSRRVELWKIRNVPGDYDWTDCTLSGVTITNNLASLSTGYTYGYIVTPQLVNATNEPEDNYKDVSKIQIIQNHEVNDGTIRYFACNDGKSYRPIVSLGSSDNVYDAIYTLPKAVNGTQIKYNTLLIRVELRRNDAGDDSPTINKIRVITNGG